MMTDLDYDGYDEDRWWLTMIYNDCHGGWWIMLMDDDGGLSW